MSEPWRVGEEIARGATAVVTRGEPGTVIKSLLPGAPSIIVRLEADALRCAVAAGLRVPDLLNADLDGDPPSLTLSFVEGVELADAFTSLGAARVGHVLAEAQHQIRAVAAPPSMVTVSRYIEEAIRRGPLDTRQSAAAMEELVALPDGVSLCHMDLHPRNVLWDGAATVIDWNNGTRGDPAADVARTRVLLASIVHYLPRHRRYRARPLLEQCAAAYVERTEHLSPGLVERSGQWDRVVAAMRLDEHPPAAEEAALRALLDSAWGGAEI